MAKTSVDRELSRAERELMRAKARVTRLRRRLPRTVVQDYSLTGAGGRRVKLSALFGRHRDVILIHNMGRTLRQVLMHLLFEPGWNPVGFLKKFSRENLPPGEVSPGQFAMTPEREKMTLRQFLDALDAQRRSVFEYLEGLSDADLSERKARIPVFKRFMGTDEISIQVYVSAFFDLHWNDHAGQIAKIRQAVGLPEAK